MRLPVRPSALGSRRDVRRVLDGIAVVVSLVACGTELAFMIWAEATVGGFVSLAVVVLGVVAARRVPWTGLVLVLTGSALAALAWDPLVPWTVTCFTVFSLTLRGLPAVASGAVAGAVAFVSVLWSQGFEWSAESYIALASTLFAAAAGSAIRNRQEYWLSLEQRTLDALATRDAEADRRVAEERLRIARDLHDVVGHEIAVVSMNLGVLDVNLPREADRAREALERSRSGVQAVLAETQSILTVLRRGVDSDEEDRRPAVGIDQLEGLLASFASIGLRVEVRLGTLPSRLPPPVDTAVYRIVQELMTNAHRHGTGSVRLEIVAPDGLVVISADNPVASGAGGLDIRRGLGLVGMRERALSVGGNVAVDAEDDAFHVTVTLPSAPGGAA